MLETPAGDVRHLGTQYEARITGDGLQVGGVVAGQTGLHAGSKTRSVESLDAGEEQVLLAAEMAEESDLIDAGGLRDKAGGCLRVADLAEEVLQNGMADFISLGRPQLADPDYVKKTMEGRTDEIVRCIACDQGCVGRMFAGYGVSCIFEPATGNEKEVVITPAETKKKLLVVGGGPAGLETARVAKERGHDVVLFEKDVLMGGQFIMAGKAPHKAEFGQAAMHMGYRAYKAGVDIRHHAVHRRDQVS